MNHLVAESIVILIYFLSVYTTYKSFKRTNRDFAQDFIPSRGLKGRNYIFVAYGKLFPPRVTWHPVNACRPATAQQRSYPIARAIPPTRYVPSDRHINVFLDN